MRFSKMRFRGSVQIFIATIWIVKYVYSISCPTGNESPVVLVDLQVRLANSNDLCTLTRVSPTGIIVPVARSYESYNWEVAAGPYAGSLTIECQNELECVIFLPSLESGYQYVLTTTDQYTTDAKSKVARFLEQATFGPTLAAINSWDYTNFTSSFEGWVKGQVDPTITPVSSHREFYRKRTNPRLEQPIYGGAPGPGPCAEFSRWRDFAITVKDRELNLTVSSLNSDGASPPYAFKVDGYVRTIVLEPVSFLDQSRTFQLNVDYEICLDQDRFYQESFSSPVSVKLPGENSNSCAELAGGNPLVDIRENESLAPYIIDLPDIGSAELVSVDENTYESPIWDSYQSGDEFLLLSTASLNQVQCAALPDPWGGVPSKYPLPPVFGRTRNPDSSIKYLVYDPRLVLYQNTIEDPLPNGGGTLTQSTEGAVICANAPRSFVNEDYCVLSTDESACSVATLPKFSITLDETTLTQLFDVTGRFVYAVDNLPLDNGEINLATGKPYTDFPCEAGVWSRWMNVDLSFCSGSNYLTVQPSTEEVFSSLLELTVGASSLLLQDVEFPFGQECDVADVEKVELGYIMGEDGICWKHAHPKLLNVYDLTGWSGDHPGGAAAIQQFLLGNPSTPILKFPDHHYFDGNMRFYDNVVNNSRKYELLGKLGDRVPVNGLPGTLQEIILQEDFGDYMTANAPGKAVVVCGSIGEVANDPSLGSGFDFASDEKIAKSKRVNLGTTSNNLLMGQRVTVWSLLALTSDDQLRQRMAFALSQILVITQGTVGDGQRTEAFLQYYDIFVRNAFGNYRDILKQVSYSERMGRMLSYIGNKSVQYFADKNLPVAYPDENFAREIMQLFSVGLVQLNLDGTPKLDHEGNKILTYTDRDIMSYARAWTGFLEPRRRGNVDERKSSVDPMELVLEWRDLFPKTDLGGGYIGDWYPLCVDLPRKHHMRRGATFRLLGGKSSPELQEDRDEWEDDPELVRLELNTNSKLLALLCAAPGPEENCTFPAKVVLDSTIACEDESAECSVDTVRTVRVQSSSHHIYYEYVRPPCVEQAFFNDARRVKDWTIRRRGEKVVKNSMCADGRRDIAAESCCNPGWESSSDVNDHGFRFCNYQGERMTYSGAENRCAANGKVQCDPLRVRIWFAGICAKDMDWSIYYSWTTSACSVKVKVRKDGDIAIVHDPDADYAGYKHVPSSVSNTTKNFFKAYWEDDLFPSVEQNTCGGFGSRCSVLNINECLCDTTVEEIAVFQMTPTKDQILSSLRIGAFHPDVFDAGTYSFIECGVPDVVVYITGGHCNNLDSETIFVVTDQNGIERYLKNMKSTISVDEKFSFRNPVHFISLVDPEVRDAYYETEAVLDSYFFHPNHAPFLATRLIQRFGISDPSQRYIEAVARAYATGSYVGSFGASFGSNKYGDLQALIAAVLLHPEARSDILDADPTHGSLREPIIKVCSFLRSMGYHHDSPLLWPLLSALQDRIGQGVYEAPSVFSFFLPEFVPDGRLGTASLVSPEAEVLGGTNLINLLSGLQATIERGITRCRDGLATEGPSDWSCNDAGNFGYLQYNPSVLDIDATIDELALLLTAGRLNTRNKAIIKNATEADFTSGNELNAVRMAQTLMISTAEFHSTNRVQRAETTRGLSADSSSAPAEPYRAIVYLSLNGGADSWNLLVPKDSCGLKDLYAEYASVRGDHAKAKADLLSLNATGSGQPCDVFGLHKELDVLKELYDSEEALFFANTGVLQRPVTAATWQQTKTPLFSHNSQLDETFRVDIEKEEQGTGVVGRLMDMLKTNGHRIALAEVGTYCVACAGSPDFGNPVVSLSRNRPPRATEDPNVLELNQATTPDSGWFGETWSAKLFQALADNKVVRSILENSAFDVSGLSKTGLDQDFGVVAKWIKARENRDVNRDAFFVMHKGYDHHTTSSEDNFDRNIAEVNDALRGFVEEMKQQGIWDSVTIIATSEFGRTLVPNSGGEAGFRGTDHGWGGHYFMLGGGVRGKQILGSYPDDLTEDGPFRIADRGRMIPSTPWEAVWTGIANWMGITESTELDYVLPNRDNFANCSMFTDQVLYRNGQVPPIPCSDTDSGILSGPNQIPITTAQSPTSPPTFVPSTQAPTVDQTISPNLQPAVSPMPTHNQPNDNPPQNEPSAGVSGQTGTSTFCLILFSMILGIAISVDFR